MSLKHSATTSLTLLCSMTWNVVCSNMLWQYSHKSLVLLCKCNSSGSLLPAPQMSTVLPRVTPARRQAWIPTDKGSIRAPSSNVTLLGNLDRWKTVTEREKKKTVVQRLCKVACTRRSGSCFVISGAKACMGKLLLVTKGSIVLVVSAQVSIVRGCGTEEDGRRQVILSLFDELVSLTGHTRLNGHSVA